MGQIIQPDFGPVTSTQNGIEIVGDKLKPAVMAAIEGIVIIASGEDAVLSVCQDGADSQIAEPGLHVHDGLNLFEITLIGGRGHHPDEAMEVRPVIDGIVVLLVPPAATVIRSQVVAAGEVVPPGPISLHAVEVAPRFERIVLPDIAAVDRLVLHVEPEVVIEWTGDARIFRGGLVDSVEANSHRLRFIDR